MFIPRRWIHFGGKGKEEKTIQRLCGTKKTLKVSMKGAFVPPSLPLSLNDRFPNGKIALACGGLECGRAEEGTMAVAEAVVEAGPNPRPEVRFPGTPRVLLRIEKTHKNIFPCLSFEQCSSVSGNNIEK